MSKNIKSYIVILAILATQQNILLTAPFSQTFTSDLHFLFINTCLVMLLIVAVFRKHITCKLRIVSNLAVAIVGRAKIHARARAKFRGEATRREGSAKKFFGGPLIFGAPLASRLPGISRALVCVFSPTPNLVKIC